MNCSKNFSREGGQEEVNKFPCGVKHNFDSGIIIKSDDRKNYKWNCSTCNLKLNVITKEDFKVNGKVLCPILSFE
ncbi:MAG: hypothetical protein ACFFB0_16590 [Promethearchaeota archaeon]